MDEEKPSLSLTIHHSGKSHPISLPSTATLQDLASLLSSTLQIPVENQKLLISPKPGLQKPPFAATRLDALIPLDSPRLKITLLGTPAKDIAQLNAQGEATRQRDEARAAALSASRQQQRKAASASASRSRGGIHTLSGGGGDNSYTFHRLLPLSYLPNPSRSQQFLARLRDDPGIRTAMAKHRFSVPLLTEMDPIEHTTQDSRTLGLNRNKGQVIELRLRTDAYDGYRDYRTIRKTLCHELAHCVFSDHDRDFWDLTAQIEREVDRADWKHGGQRLTENDFYNPGDWQAMEDEGEVFDECGWTGGEFVLGGSGGSSAGSRSRREMMARAAEERMRKEREKDA
ncbi:WLM-domain-containing protein [Aspergillus steynii IBT 23096]|uniref:WLM-domain-containing protein n=1 Tax=Aspergillus steynii IBT 23096 TaxID=1392250 RepID=A0A2I2FSL3_9EURO|nr:WLM-domain-containing protein [Aspergillus steynii IBT 23096]PLB43596.1 WLM-domain-containing protein [Aspergillus steynii IBT 23096]